MIWYFDGSITSSRHLFAQENVCKREKEGNVNDLSPRAMEYILFVKKKRKIKKKCMTYKRQRSVCVSQWWKNITFNLLHKHTMNDCSVFYDFLKREKIVICLFSECCTHLPETHFFLNWCKFPFFNLKILSKILSITLFVIQHSFIINLAMYFVEQKRGIH